MFSVNVRAKSSCDILKSVGISRGIGIFSAQYGSKLYMLVEEKPIGVVSVTKGLIEDLYILPDMQNMGYGTKLLLYAVGQCTDTPTLWILENNINAERLYRRIGFKETGRKNAITNRLDEIAFALT